MNNFNGARLLLSLLVILAHSYEIRYGGRSHELLTTAFGTLSFGDVAVNGFFVVSGYLILGSWQRSDSLTQFMWKRFLRLAPAFTCCYVVSGLVVGPFVQTPEHYFEKFHWLRFWLGLISFGQPQVPAVFTGTLFPGVNVSLWSIQYEVLCYVLLATLGITGALRSKWCWFALLIGFAVALFMGRLAGSFGVPENFSVLTKAFVRLPFYFLAGGLFYWMPSLLRSKHQLRWAFLGGCVALAGLVHPATADLGLASGGALAILSWAVHRSRRAISIIDRFDISYGLYLYAWPVSQMLYLYFPAQSALENFFGTAGISAVLGFLSWHFIEEPALAFKEWPTNRKNLE